MDLKTCLELARVLIRQCGISVVQAETLTLEVQPLSRESQRLRGLDHMPTCAFQRIIQICRFQLCCRLLSFPADGSNHWDAKGRLRRISRCR
jgi:hypothetical protein